MFIYRPMQIKVCDCAYNIEYREHIYLFLKPELGFEIVYFIFSYFGNVNMIFKILTSFTSC